MMTRVWGEPIRRFVPDPGLHPFFPTIRFGDPPRSMKQEVEEVTQVYAQGKNFYLT